MNPEEKKEIDKITKVFSRIKKDNRLSKAEVDDFMSDITKLIGIYAVDRSSQIAALLEEMLSFGDKNNLAVQGSRLEFENIKKGKFKPKL
ncbi:hypothetical protein GOV06_04695 [Candidatus Woesearchaeota archaeon]|nr:hypothetical protein [Candidatus Woesearchaeota archaeon]